MLRSRWSNVGGKICIRTYHRCRVSTNLEECIRLQIERGEDTEEFIQEAVNLLVKSR